MFLSHKLPLEGWQFCCAAASCQEIARGVRSQPPASWNHPLDRLGPLKLNCILPSIRVREGERKNLGKIEKFFLACWEENFVMTWSWGGKLFGVAAESSGLATRRNYWPTHRWLQAVASVWGSNLFRFQNAHQPHKEQCQNEWFPQATKLNVSRSMYLFPVTDRPGDKITTDEFVWKSRFLTNTMQQSPS
jgi:hypothetical protein